MENCNYSINQANCSQSSCIERKKYKFETKVDYLEVIDSENVYFKVLKKDCQIRRDIEVQVKCYNRIYGTVYSECKSPVENAVVNLIKYENCAGSLEREIVNYTITDELGSFSFLLQKDIDTSKYKIEIDGILN